MELHLKGKTFEAALRAIPDLNDIGESEVRQNASRLLKQIVRSFKEAYGGDPLAGEWTTTKPEPLGLVYGRIQSGKTRAMITTSAMAIDNGFRLVVVLTSNNNRLTSQTFKDFQRGLPGVKVFRKQDLKKGKLDLQLEHIGQLLSQPGGGIVVVTSKNPTSLSDVARFVKTADGIAKLPTIVFDDEGDEASLDTNTRRRSLGAKIKASRIHDLIHGRSVDSVRKNCLFEVFVSVTGTPQAILLQSRDGNYRVAFRELLEPGSGYVGGKDFFPNPDPKGAKYVALVDSDEKFVLLDEKQEIPNGLKDAICFFLLAAVAAYQKKGEWGEYKLLCHPSVKQDDHTTVHKQISGFIGQVAAHLFGTKEDREIGAKFKAQYQSLRKTAGSIADLSEILPVIKQHLLQREIHIINANTTNDDLTHVPHFNFMIGGNSIGRGLAIKNLLVTYYVREPKIANMDTMYQHARMFGYRKKTLRYTRVFLPYQLYARFRSIYESDERTRDFISNTTDNDSAAPIEVDLQLRPTRSNIIDAFAVVTVLPESQLYPDRPIYERALATPIREKVMRRVASLFPEYEKNGKRGVDITAEEAVWVLWPLKTEAANSWSDKLAREQLRAVGTRSGDRVRLFYRKAPRRRGEERGGRRVMPQAVLFSEDVTSSAALGYPALWIFEVGEDVKEDWDGVVFAYPTIIFPKAMKPFVFNRQ